MSGQSASGASGGKLRNLISSEYGYSQQQCEIVFSVQILVGLMLGRVLLGCRVVMDVGYCYFSRIMSGCIMSRGCSDRLFFF